MFHMNLLGENHLSDSLYQIIATSKNMECSASESDISGNTSGGGRVGSVPRRGSDTSDEMSVEYELAVKLPYNAKVNNSFNLTFTYK